MQLVSRNQPLRTTRGATCNYAKLVNNMMMEKTRWRKEDIKTSNTSAAPSLEDSSLKREQEEVLMNFFSDRASD